MQSIVIYHFLHMIILHTAALNTVTQFPTKMTKPVDVLQAQLNALRGNLAYLCNTWDSFSCNEF